MLEDPCDKVIRIFKEGKQKRDYLYEERVAIVDFLVKSSFGKNYMGKVSALHRLSYHMQYETYEKGKTIYTNMDEIDKHYLILNGRVALLECKNIEDMDYYRQRDQQFDYERTLSQHQANQQAKQLKKRCELQQYDSFGFNVEILKFNNQCISQVSDHIALVLENTHILIIKANIIQENYIENLLLNCKFLGQQLQVEYTLLSDIICEQCFKKKGMFICQETQNPRFIYCVLYGSVLFQEQSPTGVAKNRVVLGEGAIIGQSVKREKQNSPTKIQSQPVTQQPLSRQNSRYNGVQIATIEKEEVEKKGETLQSQIHSTSEYTILLMIDKEKLHQKLIEQKRLQDHTINHNNLSRTNSQNNIQKNNYTVPDIFNSDKIQKTRKGKHDAEISSPQKGRLVLQKNTRSQSYSIICKLIQKEERSNSYSRIKNQFVEYNPNYKKEYLNIEQPSRIIKQNSFNQSFSTNQINAKETTVSNNNQQNHNKNDYEDIVKRIAEKNVFALNYQKEKKYNKILMRNLKDREQIARMIVESKKQVNLSNYYSNPDNYIDKDSLMHQFHTKYLHHNIKEAKNQRGKRSYTHQTQNDNTNEDIDNFNVNTLQTEQDIDKFIQKINSQLINSQSQQNHSNHNSNYSSRKKISNKQNSTHDPQSFVDLKQEQDKLNHLTENSQQMFYPYRVQEMLDQFISLKKQESGQRDFESIQIRKASIPSMNYMDLHFQQQEQQQGQSQNHENQYEYLYHQNNFPSCQQIDEIKELNSNLPSNTESIHNLQQNNQQYQNEEEENAFGSNVEIYSIDRLGDQSSNQMSSHHLSQKNQAIQYYTQSQLTRLGSQGSIHIPQNEINIMTTNNKSTLSTNGILRSQSVHNIIRKQTESEQQKTYAVNQMYPNFRQRSQSRNIHENSKIMKYSKVQNQLIHKVLQTTELRLKKKQESQLNKVLSAECRSNNIFQPDKNIVSLLTNHYQPKTGLTSSKTSRRQSSLKARPPTSDSNSSQINLTSRQIMLSQFNNSNNVSSIQDKRKQQRLQDSDPSKTPTRTIVFSSGDRRFSRLNQIQSKGEQQQDHLQESK